MRGLLITAAIFGFWSALSWLGDVCPLAVVGLAFGVMFAGLGAGLVWAWREVMGR